MTAAECSRFLQRIILPVIMNVLGMSEHSTTLIAVYSKNGTAGMDKGMEKEKVNFFQLVPDKINVLLKFWSILVLEKQGSEVRIHSKYQILAENDKYNPLALMTQNSRWEEEHFHFFHYSNQIHIRLRIHYAFCFNPCFSKPTVFAFMQLKTSFRLLFLTFWSMFFPDTSRIYGPQWELVVFLSIKTKN